MKKNPLLVKLDTLGNFFPQNSLPKLFIFTKMSNLLACEYFNKWLKHFVLNSL